MKCASFLLDFRASEVYHEGRDLVKDFLVVASGCCFSGLSRSSGEFK
jgi:hypothetical protein